MSVDLILADIISTDMSLDPDRVVVYDQNFKAPKDQDIYVTIALQTSRIIGSNNRFAPAEDGPPAKNDREIKYISLSEIYNIEITSKNRDALTRYPAVVMALTSDYSEQMQEENQIRIFRTGQVLDLSAIEGTSSLHRYRIPVIINSTQVLEKDITTYNSFQVPQEAIE